MSSTLRSRLEARTRTNSDRQSNGARQRQRNLPVDSLVLYIISLLTSAPSGFKDILVVRSDGRQILLFIRHPSPLFICGRDRDRDRVGNVYGDGDGRCQRRERDIGCETPSIDLLPSIRPVSVKSSD